MEPMRPAVSRRRLSLSLTVWFGVVLLLASMGIAARSLHSHADVSSSPRATTSKSASDQSWMALGFADVDGGVTPLYPVQFGQVKSIEVKENQAVTANTPLFHLDDDLPRLQVQEAKIALDAANDRFADAQEKVQQFPLQVAAQKKAVDAAEINVKIARNTYDRLRNASAAIRNDADVRTAELMVEKAQAGVEIEKAKLAALEKQDPKYAVKLAGEDVEAKKILLRKAQLALDKYTVRAPFEGTVLRISISKGQTLGSNPREPAIQFCPNRPMLVRAEVEQEFAARIHKGQDAVIYDHITGEDLGHGKVGTLSRWFTHRRSIMLDPLQFNDVRTLECIIHLVPGTKELRIGQRVRVQFPD